MTTQIDKWIWIEWIQVSFIKHKRIATLTSSSTNSTIWRDMTFYRILMTAINSRRLIKLILRKLEHWLNGSKIIVSLWKKKYNTWLTDLTPMLKTISKRALNNSTKTNRRIHHQSLSNLWPLSNQVSLALASIKEGKVFLVSWNSTLRTRSKTRSTLLIT